MLLIRATHGNEFDTGCIGTKQAKKSLMSLIRTTHGNDFDTGFFSEEASAGETSPMNLGKLNLLTNSIFWEDPVFSGAKWLKKATCSWLQN